MKAYQDVDIDKTLTFYYPRIFSLLSAERHKELLEAQLKKTDVQYRIESVTADTIFPVLEIEKAYYSKARISISILFQQDSATNTNGPLKSEPAGKIDHGISTEEYPAPQATLMATLIKNQYPNGEISFDSVKNSIRIQTKILLIAVKDSISPEWSFIGLQQGDTLLNHLLNKPVIEKLSDYK